MPEFLHSTFLKLEWLDLWSDVVGVFFDHDNHFIYLAAPKDKIQDALQWAFTIWASTFPFSQNGREFLLMPRHEPLKPLQT
jgi:hypothetical protein